MQDVWISPPRSERGRPATAGAANDRYGTTLRQFDRIGGEWRIVWINPVSGAENHLRGGRDADGITLVGQDSGTPIRWQFTNIRPGAFTWRGYRWRDGEHDWRLEAEFELTRIVT
jgi:hypothetical protein